MIRIPSILIGGALAVLLLGCSEKISEEEAVRVAGIFLEGNGYPKANELKFKMHWKAGAWQGEVAPKDELIHIEDEIGWPVFVEVSRHGEVTGFMGFLNGTPESGSGRD